METLLRDLGPSLVVRLENSLGAALLRAKLLGATFPSLAGRYEIRGILGRGASGVVVRAWDVRLEREVALKLVPVSGLADEVLGEARTLAKLEHRHIVPVFDVELVEAAFGGETFRVAYVSMRLVEGATMRVWLTAERRDAAAILEKYVGAGSALAAAHRAGVLHRDFKPDNIMVDSAGHAYVVDFGLAAHAVSHASSDRVLVEARGTLPYMAPEAREGRATRASDLYALAASMDESLSGVKVGAPVRRAIKQAMNPTPERRFENVEAFLRRLEPRRLWLERGGLALLLFVTGVGVVLAGWHGSVAPAAQTPVVEMAKPHDECRELPVDWEFVTTVDSVAEEAVELGAQGRYEASFQRGEGCLFDVRLRRVSDRHAGTSGWPSRPARTGTTLVTLGAASGGGLEGEFTVALQRDTSGGVLGDESTTAYQSPEHDFRVHFLDDELRGEFVVRPSDGRYSGTLEGRPGTHRENRHEH